MRLSPSRRAAFTLIELIIVIVVLGLLAGIGVIAYTSVVTSSQDRAASLALTDVAREASALAAQNGESEWSQDDFNSALADAAAGPVLGSGVTAAGKLRLVNAAADSVNSSSMSYGQVSLQLRTGGVAGLAMKAASGHCVFVRAVLPQQVSAWTASGDLGGNCLASVGLDGGPGGTYTYTATVTSGATPLAPTELTATVSGSTVTLAWATSGGASSYAVYRSADAGSTWTRLASGVTGTGFSDPGATTAGATYTYAVTATATNESPRSATATATIKPAAPTAVSATTSGGGTQITVAWTAPAGATAFRIYRDGSPTAAAANVTGTSWADTSLTANGATHTYTVSAVNAGGEGPQSAPGVAGTVVPAAPAGVSVVQNAGNTVVSWTASPGATGYSVTISTGQQQLGLTGTSATFVVTGSASVTSASVTATNAGGTSAPGTWGGAVVSYSGTVMSASASANSSTAPTATGSAGPVAYFRLGETSGTAADLVPGGPAGTFSGPAGSANSWPGAWSVQTGNGTQLLTSGSGTTTTGGAVGFTRPVSGDYTLAAWVNETASAAGINPNDTNCSATNTNFFCAQGVLGAEVGGVVNDFGFGLWQGKPTFGGGNTTPTTPVDYTIQGPASIADGKWHYVVATRKQSTGAMAIWVDGVQVASGTGSTVASTSPANIYIGTMAPGDGYFNGAIDETAVYSRALTQSEIQTQYWVGTGALK